MQFEIVCKEQSLRSWPLAYAQLALYPLALLAAVWNGRRVSTPMDTTQHPAHAAARCSSPLSNRMPAERTACQWKV